MDVLVAIVDVHAGQWGRRAAEKQRASAGAGNAAAAAAAGPASAAAAPSLTLTSFIDQLIVFFNAFLILNKSNQLCVIAMDSAHAEFVWPMQNVHRPEVAPAEETKESDAMDTNENSDAKPKRKAAAAASGSAASASAASAAGSSSRAAESSSLGVNDDFIRQLHAFSTSDAPARVAPGEEHGSKMAGAMSLALCYLNRLHHAASSTPSAARLRSRILLFSICPDQSSQYVSMMNGIFSTQKQQIPVDSCVLSDTDSLFLQQASHLTKGIYGRVPVQNQHALLQYLMFMYLSDPTSRQHLILPTQTQVDFRATCFCHQQVVNMAVVCPVCLAIFCKSSPKCAVCGTRFAVLHAQGAAPVARAPTPTLHAPAAAAAAAAL